MNVQYEQTDAELDAWAAKELAYLDELDARARAFWGNDEYKICPCCGSKVMRPEKFSERTSGDQN